MSILFIFMLWFAVYPAGLLGLDLFPEKQDSGQGGEIFYAENFSPESGGFYSASASAPDNTDGMRANPATLAGGGHKKFGFFYESKPLGVRKNSFSLAWPLDRYNYFGLTVPGIVVEGIEKTDRFGEIQGYFSFSEYAVILGYSRLFKGKTALGVNLKALEKKMNNITQYSFGLDAGGKLFASGLNPFDIGLGLVNILPPAPGGESYPLALKAGLHTVLFHRRLDLSLDYTLLPVNSSGFFAGGLRFRFFGEERGIHLSLGYDSRQLVSGVDFVIGNVKISYSACLSKYDLSHRMGLSYILGLSPTEEEKRLMNIKHKIDREMEISEKVLRGIKSYGKKQNKAAEKLFREAADMKPSDPGITTALAEIITGEVLLDREKTEKEIRDYYAEKRYAEMKAVISDLLAYDSSNAVARKYSFLMKFQESMKKGEFLDAKSGLEAALSQFPDDKEIKTLYIKIDNAIEYMKSGIK